MTWFDAANAPMSSNTVTRRTDSKIVDETIDGVDARAGDNYVYDGAGRLTDAWLPQSLSPVQARQFTYYFDTTVGSNACGNGAYNNTAAGLNSNRTRKRVIPNGGRRSGRTCVMPRPTGATGANLPVNLLLGTGGNVAYDAHGTMTAMGDEILAYNAADRHAKTTTASATVEYVRDVTDRIAVRKVGGTITQEYSSSATGDTADLTLDAAGNIVEATMALPGRLVSGLCTEESPEMIGP